MVLGVFLFVVVGSGKLTKAPSLDRAYDGCIAVAVLQIFQTAQSGAL